MKRNIFIASLFLTSLLLTSCAPKSKDHVESTTIATITDTTILSIEDVPTSEELRKMEPNEIYKLKTQIEHIPLDSCREYFFNAITAFLNDYKNVTLDNFIIERDSLSVIKGQNRKSLYNLNFKVDLIVDTADIPDYIEFSTEISDQLNGFLRQYSYFKLKTKQLDIYVFDLNHTKFDELSYSSSIMKETTFIEQPEDEYAVQTVAFDFSDSHSDFILQKFGIIQESSELYVEYYVNDDYFDLNNPQKSIADLKKIGIEIKEYLFSEDITKQFASSNRVKLLTISFNSDSLEDSYLIFNYEL